jgi:hypothetical protein
VAISISSTMPLHPQGKPAGVPCAHLTADLKCSLFGSPQRPRVCDALVPEPDTCGTNRDEALAALALLEDLTRP